MTSNTQSFAFILDRSYDINEILELPVRYLVGSDTLFLYHNGLLLNRDIDFLENGEDGDISFNVVLQKQMSTNDVVSVLILGLQERPVEYPSYKYKPDLKYITLQDNFDIWRDKFNAVVANSRAVEKFPAMRVQNDTTYILTYKIPAASSATTDADRIELGLMEWTPYVSCLESYGVDYDEDSQNLDYIKFTKPVELFANDTIQEPSLTLSNDGNIDCSDITCNSINSLNTIKSTQLILKNYFTDYGSLNETISSIAIKSTNPIISFAKTRFDETTEINTFKSYIKDLDGILDINGTKFNVDEKSIILPSNIKISNELNPSVEYTATISAGLNDTNDEYSLTFKCIDFPVIDTVVQTNYTPIKMTNELVNIGNNAYNTDMNIYGKLKTTGNIECSSSTGYITGYQVYTAVYNDYAEYFERGEETEPGDIIALDVNAQKEQYVKATDESVCVVGVHSNTYAHIIGGIKENLEQFIPVGLAGRVYVKFNGEAKIGTKVVPSKFPGIGRAFDNMRDKPEQIVGFLLEADDRTDIRKLRMKIL